MLAAVSTAEIVARIPDEADTTTRLLAALAGRELLLVLDNCEHLVDAAAHLVQTLLERVPGLRVLATSREPLAVPGEVLHPVDALADDDAVRLFAERGAAVAPGFAVTAAAAARRPEICRRLDGQPLPIELAAARLRTLTPEEIRRRLDDRFRLLTTGPRTALPRHQTLRAVVDWSWDLLDDPERALARRLSVFAGGATEEAALRVCGLGDATLDVLTALVEKSLLVAAPGEPDPVPDAGDDPRVRRAAPGRGGRAADGGGGARGAGRRAGRDRRAPAPAGGPAGVGRAGCGPRPTTSPPCCGAPSPPATRRRRSGWWPRSAWFWLIRGLFTRGDGPAGRDRRARRPGATRRSARCAPPTGRWPPPARATSPRRRPGSATRERLAAELPAERHPVLLLMGPVAAGFGHGDPAPLERLAADPHADAWARAFALFSRAQLAENEGDLDRQRADTRAAHEMFAALGDRWGLGMTLSSLGDLESVAGEHDAAIGGLRRGDRAGRRAGQRRRPAPVPGRAGPAAGPARRPRGGSRRAGSRSSRSPGCTRS